ncbi:hypothetical protein BDV37DRAFT_290066 [Aspergillus pseudonomiae]|uniref:Uncharacterized protein n=1 Tax=Aspergillus pseudonomiae TaxID=1506151 RepID=A0A5N7CRB0_9EURO|nr:uncharacterized protein BDV37DRAFT_290066 [Aspergillus pseudonomiae]KAE8396741.1 hypothetical protein BDV37DRAFT_290066 [Aspergillus pseudonomiae]
MAKLQSLRGPQNSGANFREACFCHMEKIDMTLIQFGLIQRIIIVYWGINISMAF